MADNPIKYDDLFDFSDNSAIRQAINNINDLKKAYEDFAQAVNNTQLEKLSVQQEALAKTAQTLAEATKKLNITNSEGQKALLENARLIEETEAAYRESVKNRNLTVQANKAVADSIQRLNVQLSEQVIEYNRLLKAEGESSKNTREAAKGIRALNTEINALNATTRTNTATLIHASDSYNELDAQTKALVKDTKALGDITGKNKAIFDANTKTIAENTKRLKDMDATMGMAFRNVGNYTGEFRNFSLVLREAPAFANSFNTGLMALSNNIPMMVQEIEEASKAGRSFGSIIKGLGMSLVSLTGIFTILTTVLTFLPEILEAMGIELFKTSKANKEYAKSLKEIEEQTQENIISEQNHLNILRSVAEDTNVSMERRTAAAKEMQDLYPSLLGNYSQEEILLGKVGDAYKNLSEQIINTALARGYEEKAQAAGKKLIDLMEDQAEAEKEFLVARKETNLAIQQGNEGIIKMALSAEGVAARGLNKATAAVKAQRAEMQKFTDKASELYKTGLPMGGNKGAGTDDAARKADELIQARLKQQIAGFEIVLEKSAKLAADEIAFEKKKLAATQSAIIQRLALYKKGTVEYERIIAEQFKAESEYLEAMNKIREKSEAEQKKRIAEQDKVLQANLKNQVAALKSRYEQSEKTTDQEMELQKNIYDITKDNLDKRLLLYKADSSEHQAILAQKTDNERNYYEEINKIQVRAAMEARRILKAQMEFEKQERKTATTKQIAALKIRAAKGDVPPEKIAAKEHAVRISAIQEEQTALIGQLAAYEIGVNGKKKIDEDYYRYKKKLSELDEKMILENMDYSIFVTKTEEEKKKEIRDAAFGYANELMGMGFDLLKSNSDAKIAQLEAEKEQELEIAGNNKDAQRAIERKFNEEIRKEKRKAAIAAKLDALFSIALNTAKAVMETLGKTGIFGVWTTPILIAMGAAQAAFVAAKPIPQYAKGRRSGPEELALVNEQGPELLEHNGKFRFANQGEKGFAQLKAGEKVHTADETIDRLYKNFIDNEVSNKYLDSLILGTRIARQKEEMMNEKMISAVKESKLNPDLLTQCFKKAISDMPFDQNVFDDKGYSKYRVSKNQRIQDLNARNTSIGGNG